MASLGGGGSERVIALLANAWSHKRHAVAVVTLSGTQTDSYDVDRRVIRVGLNVEETSSSSSEAVLHNASKISHLRRFFKTFKPDVVISFGDRMNVISLISSLGLGIDVVVSERVHPDFNPIGRIWDVLRRLTYPRADALIVQAADIRLWAERRVQSRRVHVIPNPIAPEFTGEGVRDDAERQPIILGVGRLVPQKGFDLLIRAFGEVAVRHPEWTLVIVGEGPLDAELRQLARQMAPAERIDFCGVVRDLRPYYRRARIQVAPSRFEGFPNTVVEGMAMGCAVIASRCAGATSEIVQHGINGLLVSPNDLPDLARQIERLVSSEEDRATLGRRAIQVRERFALERIAAQWERIIEHTRSSSGVSSFTHVEKS